MVELLVQVPKPELSLRAVVAPVQTEKVPVIGRGREYTKIRKVSVPLEERCDISDEPGRRPVTTPDVIPILATLVSPLSQ